MTLLYHERNIHINEILISGFNNQEEVPLVAYAEDARLVQYRHEKQTSDINFSGNRISIALVPAELNLGGQDTLSNTVRKPL